MLPAQPSEDMLTDTADNTIAARQRRRPADIFLPRGVGNEPTALDFACTSGLRFDRVRASADNPEAMLADYDDFKRNFHPPHEDLATEALCRQQGFRFTPMVFEAHGGGWSKSARQTLDYIAKQIGTASKERHEVSSLALAQRLSISLQRDNARAIFRRLVDPVQTSSKDPMPTFGTSTWQ